MSFGGFGGFGQNNNNNNQQQQASAFGGFGTNNNAPAATGFGTSNSGGFGQANAAGGGMFGNNNAGGGFGAPSSGGFGANNGGGFGAKPAFGAAPSTGLFGANNNNTAAANTSAFGGFGTNNAANTSTPFGGGGNAGGGIFGANKATGFGAANNNAGSSLFGGTNTATGGFGAGTTGFGANAVVGEAPGTAATPFNAYTEKEPNTSTTNAFQNILFQEPYKKWSAEELRLVDYAQGRRHGNATGGGAFGVSTGFGNFGNNTANNAQNAGGFGGNNNNNNAAGGGIFGNNANNAAGGTSAFGGGGFGANNQNNNAGGGGIFGNTNKTGGGLFGNNNNTTQTGNTLFGGSTAGFGAANTTNAFGANNNANNAGGGLFGNNANKAGTGFSFGNTNATANAGSAFGGGNAGGGAFGSTPNNAGGTGLFGSNANNNTASAGGGIFGNSNQQQQNAGTGFGSAFGGQQNQNQNQQGAGLFGNQQKPATGGIFGNSTTNTANAGGLFGSNNAQQQQNTGGGLFGNMGNTASGGLFGGDKPATGGGIFGGGNTAQPNAGGSSLFGGQQQQTTGGGLFGANNNQQKPSGGLFGASTSSGGGLFGGQNNQTTGGSLFGNSTNQQQNQGMLGSSLLGNSQQNNSAPQGLTANLNDVSAYGSPSLFAGMGGNEVSNPGPLATPLSGSSKPRRSSILPMYKLAPATAASRFATPQKRGFGFSYSSYGTPGGSPASSISSTPSGGGLSRSLLGTSTAGSLSKSISASNLRRSFNAEDSILAPGAFSASTNARWYGSTGSKKLVINRDIRSDLFSTPQKDKADANGGPRKLSKRVSFDTSTVNVEDEAPVRAALPAPDGTPTSQPDESTPRQARGSSNGANGLRTPEMEQVKGNELAIVHEEETSTPTEAAVSLGFDNAPGEYWTKPTREELQSMNRMQRQRVDNLTVGRENVGYIRFKVPVDVSNIELDDLCGGIIQLEPRSATVYPVQAKKPPVGKGLNVPAQISLEQSWPRGGRDKRITSDPKRFNKHVARLKRIPDTTFESYDQDTGVWTFGVEHFTTYGLDDSDEESDDGQVPQHAKPTTTGQSETPTAVHVESTSHEDETHAARHNKGVPGAFDDQDVVLADDDAIQEPFLGLSSAGSAPGNVRLSLDNDYAVGLGDGHEVSDDEDLTRSSVGQHLAAELDDVSSETDQETRRGTPGGILRARMRAVKDLAGPVTLEVADGDDWMEMLRKTVSPMKRDRQLLREMNESPSKPSAERLGDGKVSAGNDLRKSAVWGTGLLGDDGPTSTQMAMDKGRGFATSIDLMNSLFERPKPTQQITNKSTPVKGFPKWPYERQDKLPPISGEEKSFRDAARPTWGPKEMLVVARSLGSTESGNDAADDSDILQFQRSGIQTERQDVRLAKLVAQSSKKFLHAQDKVTEIKSVDGVPMASLCAASMRDIFHHQDMSDGAHVNEKRAWELASILFDSIAGMNAGASEHWARKQQLSSFWADLVEQASTTNIGLAGSAEEKAVASLAGHRVAEACKYLLDGGNFRLSTLVSLIGTSEEAKKDMKEQLQAWRDSKMLSEFSEAIRTMYEILAGNVCVCEGMKNVPVEDRMESFLISQKFGLDWRQSFGLRLWYGTAQQDSAALAVLQFKDDIKQDREELPRPWYHEQGLKALWNDADEESRQDLLWGLLQLYADPENTDLEAILRPENSQLSPLDMRLSWQLGQALSSISPRVTYGQNGDEKADAATIAYAAQLTTAGEWLEAIFVLLHLRNASARTRAIQEHLCRHAGMIGPETGSTFAVLTEKFQIPASWLWEALALYMRSVKQDASAEVHCLVYAGEFGEAHRVLVQQVAPKAVVERDYATLSSLLSHFQGRAETISGWSQGGEIYGHFLSLVQHRTKGETAPPELLEKLLAGLKVMDEVTGETEVLRYAAVSDMADDTAREIVKVAKQKQDAALRTRVLSLPLTQDRLLAYSIDLGMERFREVASH